MRFQRTGWFVSYANRFMSGMNPGIDLVGAKNRCGNPEHRPFPSRTGSGMCPPVVDVTPFAAAVTGDECAAHAAQILCQGIALALQLLVLTTGAERIVIGGGLSALGNALENGIRSELTRDASTSDFVASLELADRFELLPSDVPVAALGAALLPSVAQL